MKSDEIPVLPDLPWFPNQLRAAIFKYNWAASHIPKLNEIIVEFENSDSWKPEQTSGLSVGMVRIRIYKNPPQEIGLIIGDIAHNLRAALDYATCSLINIPNPNFDTKKVQFPFGRPGMPLNSEDRSRLKNITSTALRHIEEARRAGFPYLNVLNKINNQDKHRLILSVLLRRMPIKIEIDQQTNSADFVLDPTREDVWQTPLADGDVVEMGNILSLQLGFYIEGDQSPYSLHVINNIFAVTHMTLSHMISAASIMISPTEI